MAAAIIAFAAALFLVVEMCRPPVREPASALWRTLRAVPFVAASALSLWVAGQAPRGRRPFEIDLSLSSADLALSMTKVPHLKNMAILFLLAAVALGTRRLLLALGLTMLVGVGWELAEATVIGHHGRLADLAPDLTGASSMLIVTAGVRWMASSWRKRSAVGRRGESHEARTTVT